MSPETLIRRKISNLMVTPHPKRSTSNTSDPNNNSNAFAPDEPNEPMVQVERKLLTHFRQAAECIPFEYQSNLATFVIRRPYGIPTTPALFELVSPMTFEVYAKRAHVSSLSTLQVSVTISADHSVLLLFDTAGVRYRTNPFGDFKVVPNVDDLDRPLGTVSYIDADANEKDYSLDEILEEALLVREQYCSTMISTAFGFQQRPVETVVVEREVVVER